MSFASLWSAAKKLLLRRIWPLCARRSALGIAFGRGLASNGTFDRGSPAAEQRCNRARRVCGARQRLATKLTSKASRDAYAHADSPRRWRPFEVSVLVRFKPPHVAARGPPGIHIPAGQQGGRRGEESICGSVDLPTSLIRCFATLAVVPEILDNRDRRDAPHGAQLLEPKVRLPGRDHLLRAGAPNRAPT
jgi:hypothetical protein